MRVLYSFSVQLYYLAILLAAWFGNGKAKLWLKGRKNWKLALRRAIPTDRRIIWFHVASLGEFEQARPLIEKLKTKSPEDFLLLTFFSPSGYEVRKEYPVADFISYLPLDTIKNARWFIEIVRPNIAVFVKYEFWFNFLNELNKKKIHTILVSGIFRKNQHFFQAYGVWFKSQLAAFNHFYLQNKESARLLNSIGFKNVSVTGDTRFDRVVSVAKETFEDGRFTSFCSDKQLVVFGSSWPAENEIAKKLNEQQLNVKIIIAPHEIHAMKIEKLKQAFDDKVVLLSETEKGQNLVDFSVLIVDQIGLLSKIYRYASISVIGGGFGAGIHNTLEAAVYKCPIVFGPNYGKFKEAKDLLALGGAVTASTEEGLLAEIIKLISNTDRSLKMAEKAHQYTHENSGATEQILKAF